MFDQQPEDPSFQNDERLRKLLIGSPTLLQAAEVRHMRVYRSLLDHAFNSGLWWGDIPVGLTRKRTPLAATLS